MDKDTYPPEKVILTPELIDGFLAGMAARGARKDTLGTYRNRLEMFYHYLPEDKRIRRGAVDMWAEALRGQNYAGRTVNQSISIANSLLAWVGRLDLQGERNPIPDTQAQPELTRGEYLRLLSTARSLGKDRAYLLAKVFATTGGPGGPGAGHGPWKPAAGAHPGVCQGGTARLRQEERHPPRPYFCHQGRRTA